MIHLNILTAQAFNEGGSYPVQNQSSTAALSVVTLIFILCIIVVVFLVFREIVLWYWKINEAIGLLKKIESNTRKNSTGSNPVAPRAVVEPKSKPTPEPEESQTPFEGGQRKRKLFE